jgi:hypothetical protein
MTLANNETQILAQIVNSVPSGGEIGKASDGRQLLLYKWLLATEEWLASV